jgi:hypothetical protein
MCYNPVWFISNWSLHWFLFLFSCSPLLLYCFCINSFGVGTSNAFMFWVFYLTPYFLYMFSPCHVTQVLQHCCVFPRSKDCIWGRTYYFWSSEFGQSTYLRFKGTKVLTPLKDFPFRREPLWGALVKYFPVFSYPSTQRSLQLCFKGTDYCLSCSRPWHHPHDFGFSGMRNTRVTRS